MRAFDKRFWVVLLGLALVAAACGTRVPHERVVAASGGGGGEAVASGPSGAARQGTAGGDALSAGDPGLAAPEGDTGDGVAAGGPSGAPGSEPAPGAATGPAAGGDAPTTDGQQQGGGGEGGQPASATKSPVVIGSVGNYSGPGGATIGAGAEALKVWARWINDRGGVNGHPVEVIVVDDGTDPARHQAAVKDLVENRNVLAFVAQMAPYSMPASVKYLEEKRVPVVGGDCASYLWNESPMFFNQCADLQTTLFGTVQKAAQYGKSKKWGLLTCLEAQACADAKKEYFDNGLAKQAGLEPLYSANISIAQPDFTAECFEARNRGVEIITAVVDTNTLTRIASSCARQGYRPQFAQSGGTMDAKIATNPLFDGTVISTNTFPHAKVDHPGIREFHEAFEQYAPGTKVQAFHSLGWAAAKLFERAASGLGEPATREALLEGLWSLKDETLGGIVTPLTFERDKPSPKGRCSFYMTIVKGKEVAPEGAKLTCRS